MKTIRLIALILAVLALLAGNSVLRFLPPLTIEEADLDRVDWLERDLKRVLEIEPDHADALNAPIVAGVSSADAKVFLKDRMFEQHG